MMRVVIGEDEPLLREGLAMVLLSRNGFDVVAAVGDADALRDGGGADRPDVVVTDIRMPPDHTDDGLRAAMELRRHGAVDRCAGAVAARVAGATSRTLLGDRAGGVGYLLKHRITDVEGVLRRRAAASRAAAPCWTPRSSPC